MPLVADFYFQYMEENESIDIDNMTDYLMKTYRDFARKKRTLFLKSVTRGKIIIFLKNFILIKNVL